MSLLDRSPDEAVPARRTDDLAGGQHRRDGAGADAQIQVGDLSTSGVAVDERDGVAIVTPEGILPDPLPARLAERLEGLIAGRPAVLDVSGITLVSPSPVVALAGWVLSTGALPDHCCVVCSRASARALLRKWHITRCVAVFGSVGDALQARRFAHDGYGSGWHPERGNVIESIRALPVPQVTVPRLGEPGSYHRIEPSWRRSLRSR